MTTDIEDKYPHWKDALFGNDGAVANAKCAVEYVVWHAMYLLLSAFVVFFDAFLYVGDQIAPLFGPFADSIRSGIATIRGGIRRVINHPAVRKAANYLVLLLFILILIVLIAGLVFYAIMDFWLFIQDAALVIGLIVGWIALMYIIVVVEDPARDAADRAGEIIYRTSDKAKQTPGIRRVYGECPVTLGQPPKWFEKRFE